MKSQWFTLIQSWHDLVPGWGKHESIRFVWSRTLHSSQCTHVKEKLKVSHLFGTATESCEHPTSNSRHHIPWFKILETNRGSLTIYKTENELNSHCFSPIVSIFEWQIKQMLRKKKKCKLASILCLLFTFFPTPSFDCCFVQSFGSAFINCMNAWPPKFYTNNFLNGEWWILNAYGI